MLSKLTFELDTTSCYEKNVLLVAKYGCGYQPNPVLLKLMENDCWLQ